MSKQFSEGMSRRSFVSAVACAGALASLGMSGCGASFYEKSGSSGDSKQASSEEKITWAHCSPNCYGRCALRVVTKDDEVIRVETDNTGNDEFGDHQIRACQRGRSMRRWINHPDRLKYPMKRTGKRGSGEFERISWEEAIDLIANNVGHIHVYTMNKPEIAAGIRNSLSAIWGVTTEETV